MQQSVRPLHLESLMIKPQLCKAIPVETIRKAHNNYWNDYYVELKIDGWRGIITKKNGVVQLFSRTGKEYTQHVPDIMQYVNDWVPDNTILDGEIVFYDRTIPTFLIEDQVIVATNFSTTAKIMGSGWRVALEKQAALDSTGNMAFMPFDVLMFGGEDITNLPFNERRACLDQLDITDDYLSTLMLPVPRWDHCNVKKLFDEVSQYGLEGLVLKDWTAPYVEGSRKHQLKVKSERYFDVIVYGFEPGKGKYEGTVGALKFAVFEDGGLKPIGQCSGMDDETRDIWYNWLSDYKGLEWPVIEIKCNELTVHGVPRHPQYIRSRPDKDMTECTAEQFV